MTKETAASGVVVCAAKGSTSVLLAKRRCGVGIGAAAEEASARVRVGAKGRRGVGRVVAAKASKPGALTKCACLTVLVAVSPTLVVVGYAELFQREGLVWLLEGDRLV